MRCWACAYDLFDFQHSEFSVYDYQTRKRLLYRIETKFGRSHNASIVQMSASNEEKNKIIVGKIRGQPQVFNKYNGEFKILDIDSGKWKVGTIKQKGTFFSSLIYDINYGGLRVTMEEKWNDLTMKYIANNRTYATYRRHLFFNLNTYDLNIYNDELPVTFYLIGLAVVERKPSMAKGR
ncbi:unnamed protein product [Didymodactylos carnosus]|uniref:Uncharacterized protein n=1 Tax=Didymodactylos carnosus TaxID=1234261 RepID=A0A815BC73_9BILA|nr:unnamed protein product [Didymodactylos carnosus]CAF4051896.1 unnamed protein product [Didymodactylos carnosus]